MNGEKQGSRPVRIHLAMKDGPLPRSIRQVLPIVGNESSHVYVENLNEADLVIFTEVRDIEGEYSKEKSYAYLQTPSSERAPRLPENCHKIDALDIIVGLLRVIAEARKGLKPLETPKMKSVAPIVALLPDAKRILVVEDTPKHQESALVGLAGHHLTVVKGYEEAMEVLGNEKIDVVLTDLMMPMISETLSSDAFKLGELVQYGLFLMIEAAHRGVKYVAVVSDLNHHANWAAAAFDHFRYPVQIDGAKAMMMHAPMRKKEGSDEYVKDWAKALETLLA